MNVNSGRKALKSIYQANLFALSEFVASSISTTFSPFVAYIC